MFSFDFDDDLDVSGKKSSQTASNSLFQDTLNLPEIGNSSKLGKTNTSNSLFGDIFDTETSNSPQTAGNSTFPSLFDFTDASASTKSGSGQGSRGTLDIWGNASSEANNSLSLFGEVSTKNYGLSLFANESNTLGSATKSETKETKAEDFLQKGIFSSPEFTPTKEHRDGAVHMQRLWRGKYLW